MEGHTSVLCVTRTGVGEVGTAIRASGCECVTQHGGSKGAPEGVSASIYRFAQPDTGLRLAARPAVR